MTKRLVVTGGTGLLGATVIYTARELGWDVAAGYHRFPLHADRFRTFDMAECEAVIDEFRPTHVVHCVAATNVDWCEAHPVEAHEIHVALTSKVAAAAQRVDAGFVYVSTDSVFDGERGGYRETDTPNPLNVYARTKLEGESAARDACVNTLVVRTNLFGWNLQPKVSLAEWVLVQLEEQKKITGFTDVRFSPLLVNELAEMLLRAADAGLRGLFHLGASDGCSKFEFARTIAAVFDLRADLIEPGTLRSANLGAPRPLDTTLDASAIATALGVQLPTVRSGVERMRRQRDEGYLREFRMLAKER